MSACYCEVSPDPLANEPDERFRQDVFSYTGVFDLWGKRDPSRTDNPTALGAWAWALSRGLDLAERIPELDAKRSVVTGCSRLGKAALLAAARDDRFALCVPNQCGGGGVSCEAGFGEKCDRDEIFPLYAAPTGICRESCGVLTLTSTPCCSIAPRRILSDWTERRMIRKLSIWLASQRLRHGSFWVCPACLGMDIQSITTHRQSDPI